MTPEQAALLDKIGRRTLAILNNNPEAAQKDGTKEPNRLRDALISLGAAVDGLDEATAHAVLAALGDAEAPPEETAAALRAALGDKADAVFRAGLGE